MQGNVQPPRGRSRITMALLFTSILFCNPLHSSLHIKPGKSSSFLDQLITPDCPILVTPQTLPAALLICIISIYFSNNDLVDYGSYQGLMPCYLEQIEWIFHQLALESENCTLMYHQQSSWLRHYQIDHNNLVPRTK